ncbi:MAG TPA: stomatin-like protein [bacterium]|nr:stomatin-like protein [bacterium]
MSLTGTIIVALFILFILIVLFKTAVVVPQKNAYIVERLGKYSKTLDAGLHILVPFLDKVAYKHTLKEEAIDVEEQTCITKDNITVEVDGILYLQVFDPKRASYGIDDYRFAAKSMAQTTMRSEMGKMELDKTFEEREKINAQVVGAVDEASDPWGIKVTRYEIKDITPPETIKDAMEQQMRAERKKRAEIAESEGERQAAINIADGEKQKAIAISEGEKQSMINVAEGEAQQILRIAEATSTAIEKVAEGIRKEGGDKAVSLRIAEAYIREFGNLARENNTMIIPSNLSDIAGVVASLGKVIQETDSQPE